MLKIESKVLYKKVFKKNPEMANHKWINQIEIGMCDKIYR